MRILTVKTMCALAMISTALTFTNGANAYYIQPFVQQGMGTVNGLDVDGATQGSVNFTTSHQSSVNLSDGTVKAALQTTGPNNGLSGLGQVFGTFGDRVTFNGAAGTQLGFNFNYDGSVVCSNCDLLLNSDLQIRVTANISVFDPDSGADHTNFRIHPGALVNETKVADLSGSFGEQFENINEFINESLFGSLTGTGDDTYDVFASLNLFIFTGENPVTVAMDFLNTGTFGITTDPGVTFTSESGVLVGSVPPSTGVPLPATLSLFGLALAGLGFSRRKSA